MEKDKRVFSYFLLLFPSVLIALIPQEVGGSGLTTIAIKALLVFYQALILKNFVDTYYD